MAGEREQFEQRKEQCLAKWQKLKPRTEACAGCGIVLDRFDEARIGRVEESVNALTTEELVESLFTGLEPSLDQLAEDIEEAIKQWTLDFRAGVEATRKAHAKKETPKNIESLQQTAAAWSRLGNKKEVFNEVWGMEIVKDLDDDAAFIEKLGTPEEPSKTIKRLQEEITDLETEIKNVNKEIQRLNAEIDKDKAVFKPVLARIDTYKGIEIPKTTLEKLSEKERGEEAKLREMRDSHQQELSGLTHARDKVIEDFRGLRDKYTANTIDLTASDVDIVAKVLGESAEKMKKERLEATKGPTSETATEKKAREFKDQNREVLTLLNEAVRELKVITGADQARAQEVAALIEGILARDARDPEHPIHEVKIDKEGFRDRKRQEGIPVDEAMELLAANGKGTLANTLKEKSKSYWHWHYGKETSGEVDWTDKRNKDDQHLYTESEAGFIMEERRRRGDVDWADLEKNYQLAKARLEKRREIRLEPWKKAEEPQIKIVEVEKIVEMEKQYPTLEERLRHDTNIAKVLEQCRIEGLTEPAQIEKRLAQAAFAEVDHINDTGNEKSKEVKETLKKMVTEELSKSRKLSRGSAFVKQVHEITGIKEDDIVAAYDALDAGIKNDVKAEVLQGKAVRRTVRRVGVAALALSVNFIVPGLGFLLAGTTTLELITDLTLSGMKDKKDCAKKEKELRNKLEPGKELVDEFLRRLTALTAEQKQFDVNHALDALDPLALKNARDAHLAEVKKNKGAVDRHSAAFKNVEKELGASEDEKLERALEYMKNYCKA